MSTVSELLKKPFPQEESFAATVKVVTAICVFVVVFLYVFKPFGLHTIESNYLLLCLGFGAVSFIASLLYEGAIRLLRIKGDGAKFSFGRWIVYFLGAMLVISLANFLFVRLIVFGNIEWALFPYMMRGTFAIGIFPVLAIGAFALLKQERKYQSIAAELNEQEGPVANSEAASEVSIFGIPCSRVRYIEAMQNYIKIQYVDSDRQLKEHIERATLKSLASDSLGAALTRCHRSFFVNRDAIESTSGNAQGLLLRLNGCDREVPVSRSYVQAFRQR